MNVAFNQEVKQSNAANTTAMDTLAKMLAQCLNHCVTFEEELITRKIYRNGRTAIKLRNRVEFERTLQIFLDLIKAQTKRFLRNSHPQFA